MQMPSIAGEQPKPCRSAGGNPSSRSVRSNGCHSDGNAAVRSGRIPGPACLCDACTSVWLCRSLLSFAIHLAPPRNHGSEAHDANETGSCRLTLAPVAYWYEPAVCAKNIYQPLRIRTVNARPEARSRLERRAASAGRSVRTAQPTSFVLGVIYTGDACTQPAAAGLRLESRRRWHMCAIPC
jgi:hypothetical protein